MSALLPPPEVQKEDLKARDNPFASCHLERLPFRFLGGVTWDIFFYRLQQNQWSASVVGAKGSGKTTLLEQCMPQLRERGFEPVLIRLSAESRREEKDQLADQLRAIKKPGFILLDGAEQLTTRQWLPVRAAASYAAGLLVSVHRMSRLPVILELETNATLLGQLVEELTGAVLPKGEAAVLWQRHYGNVRECLRELYDRWAG